MKLLSILLGVAATGVFGLVTPRESTTNDLLDHNAKVTREVGQILEFTLPKSGNKAFLEITRQNSNKGSYNETTLADAGVGINAAIDTVIQNGDTDTASVVTFTPISGGPNGIQVIVRMDATNGPSIANFLAYVIEDWQAIINAWADFTFRQNGPVSFDVTLYEVIDNGELRTALFELNEGT